MRSVPQPTKLQFDLSGSQHLICVTSEVIDVIYTRLEELEHIPQNIQILQLGETVKARKDWKIEQFNSVENLQKKLREILERAYIGTRFYAIGSAQFIYDVENCARSFGMSEEEISLEVFDSKARRVYCSTCHTINYPVSTNLITCSGCGIKLEIWEHFSRLKNAYLGVCADAENPGDLL
ncbi:conserved hypothetical protein [Hyella patelloides LEGE 07179]|uniref:Uncharacterized protein n=1 Tax=Hyella patelloides LEGE 07179 TaxID=945734 RepID=A0A563VY55_9CYAN|nr:dimethylamine monooxygenase subunit DmmA family protein [Hyella patelloides]VEP16356.1 conserved hypothetical protein [Hyella patelloides LEGE 07179]